MFLLPGLFDDHQVLRIASREHGPLKRLLEVFHLSYIGRHCHILFDMIELVRVHFVGLR